MTKQRIAVVVVAIAAIVLIAAAPEKTATLKDLTKAYDAELSAREAYKAYAKVAVTDGYLGVGSLFRALSQAENVHAARHAALMKTMGATPPAVKPMKVKTGWTGANLDAAIAAEKAEIEAGYPPMIDRATKAGDKNAVDDMSLVRRAEVEHQKLLADVKGHTGNYMQLTDFFVCSGCGNVMKNAGKCPVCGCAGCAMVSH